MPVTFKPVLNSKPKQDGTFAILIRITLDRKRKHVNTGQSVKKKDWNSKGSLSKGFVRSSHPFAASINEGLKNDVAKVEAAIMEAKLKGEPLTLDQIQLLMQGKEVKALPVHYTDFALDQIELYYPTSRYLYQNKNYKTTLEHWKEFEKKETKHYLINQIDLHVLKRFENYLKIERNNQVRTIANHLKRTKRIFKLAVDLNLIEYHKNPFMNLKISTGGKSNKPRLTFEEVARLEQAEPKPGSVMYHAKHIWLAQFYAAGTRIGDMLVMKWRNIVDSRLIFTMQKTRDQQTLPINPKLQAILDIYKTSDKGPNDYIFPFFKSDIIYSKHEDFKKQLWSSTALINKELKKLARLAEIDKNLTTHMARHTFADLARQKSGNIYGVSKALRHSNIKITETYLASFDNQAVDDVMDSVFGEL